MACACTGTGRQGIGCAGLVGKRKAETGEERAGCPEVSLQHKEDE